MNKLQKQSQKCEHCFKTYQDCPYYYGHDNCSFKEEHEKAQKEFRDAWNKHLGEEYFK